MVGLKIQGGKYKLYIEGEHIANFNSLCEMGKYIFQTYPNIIKNAKCETVILASIKGKIKIVEKIIKPDGTIIEMDYNGKRSENRYKIFLNKPIDGVNNWGEYGPFASLPECLQVVREIYPSMTVEALRTYLSYYYGKLKYKNMMITYTSERDRLKYNTPDYTVEGLNASEPQQRKIVQRVKERKVVTKGRKLKYLVYILDNLGTMNVHGAFFTYTDIAKSLGEIYPNIKTVDIISTFQNGILGCKKFPNLRISKIEQ